MKKYLTPEEAAKILNRTVETLKYWRHKEQGPEFIKDKGGRVWYTEEAIENFIEGK